MSKVEEIKAAIDALPKEEYAQLRESVHIIMGCQFEDGGIK